MVTKEQAEGMMRLRERGWSISAIAKEFGRGYKVVAAVLRPAIVARREEEARKRIAEQKRQDARFGEAFEAGYRRCWGDVVLRGSEAAHGFWMSKLIPWRNHGGGNLPPMFVRGDGGKR